MAEPSTSDVAVVIPARPAENFLAEAVASVLCQPEVVELAVATHQTGSPTALFAAEHPDPRVRLVVSHGPAAGSNLDAGIEFTTAPWLAFLDADDLWPPGRLAAGLRAAQCGEGIGLIVGRLQEMGAGGELLDTIIRAPVSGTVLITRTAAQEVGPFGEDLISQMRWMVRARELGITAVELDRVMLYRRAHSSNLSRLQRPELQRAYLTFVRERTSRRRRAQGEAG